MKKFLLSAIGAFFVQKSAASVVFFETSTGAYDSVTCCGTNIGSGQFIGTLFSLASSTEIDNIGGHFTTFPGMGGDLFGAIVSIGSSGLPSGNLTSLNNVVVSTTFVPNSGVDTLVPLAFTLPAGDYALVFGSGLFGSTGDSTLTLIQPFQELSTNGQLVGLNASSFPTWSATGSVVRKRLFLTSPIPEPSRAIFVLLGLMFVSCQRRR